MKFVACRPGEFGGVSNLKAQYRVQGKDVLNVEDWLVRLAHVSRLKRACCVWETSIGNFTGRDGADYYVSMGTEATIISRRDLSRVPFFELNVTHYLHSP
ncbi:DUF4952 domain-containing protein [Caballeronia sp. SL2Y3]|uniref:DUF4952 domain-containing protein n=1 Tax=Caballeronia sp. SL2Y3 TaxID=2878151 RepID=UPI00351CE34C